MALIQLTVSELDNIKSQISKLSSKSDSARNSVSKILSNLDMEVKAKKNIEEQLQKIKRDLSKQSEKLASYSNVLSNVADDFVNADHLGKNLNASGIAIAGVASIPLRGGPSGFPDPSRWVVNEQISKIAKASMMKTPSQSDVSILDKIWNWGKEKAEDIGDSAKKAYGNVVQAGKDCVSWIDDKFDDAQKWYGENKEKLKAYGKGALKVAAGVVTVAGSVVAIVGTGGASIPLTMITAIGGINNIASGAADLVYAHNEQYDMIGKTDALKEQVVSGATEIGAALGNAEAGEKAGEWIYTGYNVVNFLDGADKMLKSLGKVNTVVTGSTGYSDIWGKTSFDDIADNKIKFKLDASTGFEPDYVIRKILGVDGSSDGNIIYEGAKSVYKMFGKAASLGKEIAENL